MISMANNLLPANTDEEHSRCREVGEFRRIGSLMPALLASYGLSADAEPLRGPPPIVEPKTAQFGEFLAIG